MNFIWKFPIDIASTQNVLMPEGAKILKAGVQGAIACLWAEVIPTAPPQRRAICIVGTGHPLAEDEHREYLGTVQMGEFVWHIFEQL